jgi:rhodanese-related sulfurtransferase
VARDVSVLEARQMMNDEGAILLDVREDFEWTDVRAPDALHIPMRRLSVSTDQLPGQSRLLCICHVGQRSAVVAEALVRAGYDAVNVAGGMDAWEAAGLPVERG